MIISDACISQLTSPVRTIKARVELYEGSTLQNQFCYTDRLISFDIQRVGEGKFFGFGICHRLNIHLRDKDRELAITTANSLDISFGAGCEYVYPFPNFHVSEVHRDEKTNELSITAYDALYKATEHTIAELGLEYYTIRELATACATLLGLPMKIIIDDETPFNNYYAEGANFEGTENLREVLNAIAEATQTIYYLDSNWNLTFKRLDKDGEPVATIDKELYLELKNRDNRRLANVCHATELGDNYISTRRGYVEGNPVSVNDCSSGTPLEIAIASNGGTLGKNLFNIEDRVVRDFGALPNTTVRNFTDNSVYLNLAINNYCNAGHKMKCEIVSDNSFTVLTPSNSAGGWEAYGAGFNFRTKPNITYSVSASYDNTKGKILGFSFFDATGKYISSTPSTQNVITPNNSAWMNVVFTVQVRDEAVLFENIQLEQNTATTEYEPYSNTYGPGGIEVRASGKNLFNYKDFVAFTKESYPASQASTDITYLDEECFSFSQWRPVGTEFVWMPLTTKENTQYTISFEASFSYNNNATYSLPLFILVYSDGTTFTIGGGSDFSSTSFKRITYTTALNKTLVGISTIMFSGSAVVYVKKDMMIEEGTAATEYEPYAGPVQVAYADAEGKVEGLVSYTPSTIITANHPNAIIYTNYLKPQLSGTVQYVRDNPFWELRSDIAELVDVAGEAMYGITINQFECNWRGNFLLEIGDKIALVSKDNTTFYSYLLDDTIEYDGTYSQKTQWQFEENEGESADNPTSLGDVLKRTYARVDKQNKQIDIVASEQTAQSERLSQLQLTTENINSTVAELQQTTAGSLDNINANLVELNTKLRQTAEDFSISINKIEGKDAERITTTTGFTFNEEGMRVAKTNSEMETLITEDGMTVYKGRKEVLVADNEGVKAIDLHATTFLIIGDNSRFEDYGSSRTACFWIGG